jgi:hypothetical protein
MIGYAGCFNVMEFAENKVVDATMTLNHYK